MRMLNDGEVLDANKGCHGFQVFLDGVEIDNVWRVQRDGDAVEIYTYAQDGEGRFYVDASGKSAERELHVVSAGRVSVLGKQANTMTDQERLEFQDAIRRVYSPLCRVRHERQPRASAPWYRRLWHRFGQYAERPSRKPFVRGA